MDLTETIDRCILPHLSPRAIKFIARNSWGRPRNLRTRITVRLAELGFSLCMPKPELVYKRDDAGDLVAVYPVRYRRRNLLIIPMPGIRCTRVYVVCNAICHLLKK